MPSINLDNLERYDSKARNEAEEEYMPKDSGNWQKTDEAGAVVFYPVPNTPLEGKVKFSFTETPPASGDKGPSNPSTIRGVNRINLVRANSNLLPYPYWLSSGFTANGITYIINEDGSVSATGTAESSSYFPFLNSNSPSTEGLYLTTDTYKYFGCPEGGSWNNWGITCVYGSTNTPEITNYDYGSGGVIKLSKPGKVSFAIRIAQGVTVSNLTFYPRVQIIEAPFEKNEQDAYNIDLGGTYYGGVLDVASGVMTVTKEFVTLNTINASDGIAGGNAIFRAWPESLGMWKPINDGSEVCEELPRATSGTGVNRFFIGAPIGGNCPIYVILNPSLLDLSGAADPSNPTAIEVRAAGIAYLNAHPLHMVLSLETPITVQLTPTEILSLAQTDKCMPRLNTVYTDADTIQIGYMKSPQRTEQELTQAVLEIESDDSD